MRITKRAMSSVTNLVYYASVSRESTVLVEHRNPKEDLAADVGVECLEKVPPYHLQFSYTIKQRMFIFLIDSPFIYCAIVDEALGKGKTFGFLERVRDEFKILIRSRGLDPMRLDYNAMSSDFAGVFKHLVKPLVGIPQKDFDLNDDNLSDSKDDTCLSPSNSARAEHSHPGANGGPSPLTAIGHRDFNAGKKPSKDQQVKEIMMTNSGKALETCNASEMDPGLKKLRNRQIASQMWWKNVKLVLILDLVVCFVLFAIWLGICGGFSCVK